MQKEGILDEAETALAGKLIHLFFSSVDIDIIQCTTSHSTSSVACKRVLILIQDRQ